MNYFDYSGATLWQRFKYRFLKISESKDFFESLKLYMYTDQRYTYIENNLTQGISLDLQT